MAKAFQITGDKNCTHDDLLFITHITSQGNALNIFNDNLLMPAGVSSTTGIVTKEQLKQILFDLAEGKSPHRGYLDMFIGAIDRTTLESVNGKTLQDKLENYLDENFIEDVAKTQLPSSLNIGYFTDGVLNTKYDSKTSEGKPDEAPYNPSKRKRRDNTPEYRMVGVADNDRMTNAEFEIFKAWHAKNAAGIPFEDLDRMIQVNDTEQAWGVFEEGVAKFVRGGLKGTEYHEIFEGIWASFLSESEREAILNEFRNQEGQFTDRQSGKK